MKKCSTNVWDPQTRTASGCDYIEWIKGTTENLEEDCPKCSEKLVLVTTASGKRLKKCSTNKWDKESRMVTGCDFVEWQ
jgi:ssDNA-binding Zn-finger/Zn-ribbon topoisomerase 1